MRINPPKYPLASTLLTEARLYALESADFTMDYDGWKDQHSKLERITIGKLGQIWMTEFCRLNDIRYKADKSSPRVTDQFDIEIQGCVIDVKTSVILDLVGQVGPGVINKKCDYFCFLLSSRMAEWVQPFGFIHASEYRKLCLKINEGDYIPNTRMIQRFKPHTFLMPYSSRAISPFWQTLARGLKKDVDNVTYLDQVAR